MEQIRFCLEDFYVDGGHHSEAIWVMSIKQSALQETLWENYVSGQYLHHYLLTNVVCRLSRQAVPYVIHMSLKNVKIYARIYLRLQG